MFYTAGFIISLLHFACCSAETKECKDESIFCNVTKINVCFNEQTSKLCRETCGLCNLNDNTTTVRPTQECSDIWMNCTKLDVDCQNDSDIAKIYCYKTCSSCTTTISTTTSRPNVATHFANSWHIIIHFILFFTTTKFMV